MSNNGTTIPATSEPAATPTPTQEASTQPSLTEPSTDVPPTSEAPTSSPVAVTSQQQTSQPPAASSRAPAASSQAPASKAPASSPPASSQEAARTSVVTASAPKPSTAVVTSVVTPSASVAGETPEPSTIVLTVTDANSGTAGTTDGIPAQSAAPTDSSAPGLADPKAAQAQGGLNTGGKTAIAVVVPVVVVALLVLAGILLWRKRKSKKSAEEARRKEVEEYGYNPNNDPTLPAVGMQSEMAEDESGYRGWGNTATSSNRKGSTTLTSGLANSDSNSNPGGYQSPSSPTHGTYSDNSGDPLVNGRRTTMDSDGIGALGAAPAAASNGQSGVQRGPSNASSSYSAADRSDNSGEYPLPNIPQDYYHASNEGYYQNGPYDNAYGGQQQPIIRDVSARRNTRIENPAVFPQQGNSGIAQNF